MKHIAILVIAMVFSGCVAEGFVDPELQPYVTAFEREYGVDVTSAVVFRYAEDYDRYGEPYKKAQSVDRAGVCYPIEGTIVIKGEKWETLNESSRRFVMYHEMGHCDMGLKHEHDELIHMMNTKNVLNGRSIDENWSEYVESIRP